MATQVWAPASRQDSSGRPSSGSWDGRACPDFVGRLGWLAAEKLRLGPAARGRQSARLRPLCSLPPSLSRSGLPTTSEVRRMGQERESRGRESVELWSMCVACAKTCASCSGTWIEAGLEHTFSAFHGCCQFEPVGRGVAAHGTSSLRTAETCGCTEQRVSFVLHIAPCFVKFSIRTLLDLCGTAVL